MQEKLFVEHDVYILYQDVSPDRDVAAELKKRLERFRLPGRLRRDLSDESRRIGRIYLDSGKGPETGTSSAADAVTEGLTDAEWLVLICTPRLPGSPRTDELIERYKTLHGHEHILALLVEGEPVDSFPSGIRFTESTLLLENGQTETIRKEVEPLAAEVRATAPRERRRQLDDTVMRMAAPMFDLNYDDLRQRHRERRLRRLAAVCGTAGAVFLLTGLICLFLAAETASRNRIIETQTAELSDQYTETQRQYALAMAHVSDRLLEKGRRLDALYAIRSAMPASRSEEGIPYVSAAARALTHALGVYDLQVYLPEEVLPLPSEEEWNELKLPCEYASLEENAPVFPYYMDITDPDQRIRISDSLSLLLDAAAAGSLSGDSGKNGEPSSSGPSPDSGQRIPDERQLQTLYTLLSPYTAGRRIVDSSRTADGLLLLGAEGSLYQYLPAEGVLEDFGLSLYQTAPSGTVEAGALRDEEASLFIRLHSADYLIRYGWKGRDGYSSAAREENRSFAAGEGDLLREAGDSVLSDDGLYRAVLTEGGALQIFRTDQKDNPGEAETPVSTLYGSWYDAVSLRKIPDSGCYLLELPERRGTLILDDCMQIVGSLSFYYGYNPEERLLLRDNHVDWWDAELICVPLRSYEELIGEADRLLEGYVPPERIRKQYRMLED